jgi:hypothetical protein
MRPTWWPWPRPPELTGGEPAAHGVAALNAPNKLVTPWSSATAPWTACSTGPIRAAHLVGQPASTRPRYLDLHPHGLLEDWGVQLLITPRPQHPAPADAWQPATARPDKGEKRGA